MNYHRIIPRLCSLIALAALPCVPLNAAVILSENFEGIDISGGPVAISTANSVFTTNVSGGSFLVINNNPPPLPTGGANNFTGSQYLQYVDGTGSPSVRAPLSALSSTFVASFDYFEPNETTGTQTTFRFVLASGNAGTTTNRAVEINLGAGNSAATGSLTAIGGANPATSYDANVLNHFDLVGSFVAGTTAYGAGSTFPAGDVVQFTYDIYVNGVLALDNAPFRNNLASADELAFVVAGSAANVQTAYLDNITIDNAATVPEPSSLVLSCFTLLAAVGLRRRR